MDDAVFDKLVRDLNTTSPRRAVLRALAGAGAALALLAGAGGEGAAAHDAKVRCRRIGDPARRRACLGDARRHNRAHAPTPPPPPPRTVTQTFANPNPIAINSFGSAAPFPSTLRVTGLRGAAVTDVDLVLAGFGHAIPRDVDVLLVAPDGRNAFVLSDVGRGDPVTGLVLRLDDEAAAPLPTATPLTSGTFRPANHDDLGGRDVFDNPAPVPSGNVALAIFDGMDPDGEWRLFIRDDSAAGGGQLAGGWELRITATLPGGRS